MVCRVFAAVACVVSVASASQRSPSAKSIDIRMESAVGSGSKRAFLRSSFAESSASMLSAEAGGGDAGSDALGLLQDLAPTAGASGAGSDGGASSAMKGLGRYPGPISRAQGPAVDPVALDESWHCETDFSQACPNGFVAGSSGCVPTSAYQGPCASDVRSFDGLSDAAKARWSSLCLASWPCVDCDRDFAAACPKGWASVDGQPRHCQAPGQYVGPCAAVAGFDGFNAAMLSQWSTACGAFWECKKRGDTTGGQ
jgi:CPW-WPC domain-containing protein